MTSTNKGGIINSKKITPKEFWYGQNFLGGIINSTEILQTKLKNTNLCGILFFLRIENKNDLYVKCMWNADWYLSHFSFGYLPKILRYPFVSIYKKEKKRNFSEFILADHRKQLHFAEFIWSFRGKSPLINSLGWHFMSNKKQLSVSVHLVVYKIKIKLTKPT